MFNGWFLASVLRSLGAVPGRLAHTQELVPVSACDADCEQWPLVEGEVPSQVSGAFCLSQAWEGRGLSLPAWRGFQGAGVSRDPKCRQSIPHQLEGGHAQVGRLWLSMAESFGNFSLSGLSP